MTPTVCRGCATSHECNCCVQAQRGRVPSAIHPWEMNRGLPTPSAASNPAASPAGSSSSRLSAASDKRASAAPWVPGKKGRLFPKRSSSSGSSVLGDSGLEPLQNLIPPEVARARLKVWRQCIICMMCDDAHVLLLPSLHVLLRFDVMVLSSPSLWMHSCHHPLMRCRTLREKFRQSGQRDLGRCAMQQVSCASLTLCQLPS